MLGAREPLGFMGGTTLPAGAELPHSSEAGLSHSAVRAPASYGSSGSRHGAFPGAGARPPRGRLVLRPILRDELGAGVPVFDERVVKPLLTGEGGVVGNDDLE